MLYKYKIKVILKIVIGVRCPIIFLEGVCTNYPSPKSILRIQYNFYVSISIIVNAHKFRVSFIKYP